jgi:hypothetical protein
MTILEPPPVAARLLERLVPAQDHEALLGDLCEECHRRRSIAWYCLQILAAIIVGSWKDTRLHWALALRAIAVGVASFLAYFQVVVISGVWNLPIRWLGPHHFVAAHLLFGVGFIVSGWVIVRLHRAHGIALAMPFMAVIAVLMLTDVLGQSLLMSASTPVGVFILWTGAKCVSFPLSILLGGYWATRSMERA